MVLVFRFAVRGRVRFLSHAETMRLFRRALSRAGIEVDYTRGFNPRARLSLGLPRSVGLESEDEVLAVRMRPGGDEEGVRSGGNSAYNGEELGDRLGREMPVGVEVLSAELTAGNSAFEAAGFTCEIKVRRAFADERLKSAVDRLNEAETLAIERRTDAKGAVRELDVRGFIKSALIQDDRIIVECAAGPAGSVRVEEILMLLGLDTVRLAGAVRRTKVLWTRKN
jgi:radical SAM-linked protein